ncbi:MAG TPA: choice-of-anchor tandem repeat GloVer-containing protein [Rhizomicrobium sp.]|jgi:uncharacterized repeat protein (TIGR03803 family)|nr:choice-of-anchor tandem repeat GloVer-containing protein [Rhizomicrobium sp.]
MPSVRSLVRSALLGSAFALCTFAANGHAESYTVLHDFAGPPSDGSYSYNNISFGADGAIYGAANLGGAANAGVIFELAPDGTYKVLHSFDGGTGGSDPNAGVTVDPTNGDLYGTTTFGGIGACRNGCGVFYKLAADGTYSVLHSFDSSDGRYPAGQLVRDKLGNIYGVATSGGPDLGGVAFEYSTKGAFTVLHAFSDSDGFSPQGSLLLDRAGNLYGVTNSGGADEYGTVFKLTPKGKLTTLYSFTGGNDGGYPTGGLDRDKAGNLYGATNLAGNGSTPFGTVFKLASDGTLTTLYAFTGGADGGYPAGNVLQVRGKLYGTTTAGGTNDDGIVYEIDPATGNETVLHRFADTDGANPQAGLSKMHGRLYGTASGGGDSELGVVFSLKKK